MTSTPGVDQDLVDMMNTVLADHRAAAQPTGPSGTGFDEDLWRHLDELGLVRLTGTEARGGSGTGWPEAVALITAAARHGVRLPLAEHDLLAGWLAETLDMPDHDSGVRTVCVVDADGIARGVPWASSAGRIIVVRPVGDGWRAADVPSASVTVTPGVNLVGEPRDTVAVAPGLRLDVGVPEPLVDQLRLKAAMVRAVQVCAALDQALELAVQHVTTRVQFGRRLGSFQAVQGMVADCAGECALGRAATEAALVAAQNSEWGATDLAFRVAVARSCVGHAASLVVRHTHQVHGAIGTTREHPLHDFTRAALAWRSEFGSVRFWDDEVTRLSSGLGPGGLWDLIAG